MAFFFSYKGLKVRNKWEEKNLMRAFNCGHHNKKAGLGTAPRPLTRDGVNGQPKLIRPALKLYRTKTTQCYFWSSNRCPTGKQVISNK